MNRVYTFAYLQDQTGCGMTRVRNLCLLALFAANAAVAEEPTAPELSATVTLVSDYIWRGQSQTWGKPALQVGVEAAHHSGAYAGVWTSNVSPQWVPGAQLETDWYAGYRNKFKDSEVGYDLNFQYAYFPGGNFNRTGFNLPSSSPNTAEVYAAINYRWLTLKTGRVLSKFYGWNTVNSGPGGFAGDANAGVTGDTNGSYFIEANASQEIAEGWNAIGQFGHQTIRNSRGLNWSYYKIGISKTVDKWVASVACTASSEPAAYKNFLGLTNNGSAYSLAKTKVLLSVARNF